MDTIVQNSIIIPNLNSPIINQTIDSILAQDASCACEIIIVGQDTDDILSEFGDQVIFVQTEAPVNAAVARNIGIARSVGKHLLFLDADCVPDPGWLNAMVSALEAGWDVVGGGVRIPRQDYLSLVYNFSMFHEFLWTRRERKASYLPTLNLALKRAIYEQIGGLDEKLDRSQDLDWTMRMARAGAKILFTPTATITHKPLIHNFQEVRKQFFRSGFFSRQVRQEYQSVFSSDLLCKDWFWRWFSPIIALGSTIKILLTTPPIWTYFYILPAVYLTKTEWCLGAAKGLANKRSVHE